MPRVLVGGDEHTALCRSIRVGSETALVLVFRLIVLAGLQVGNSMVLLQTCPILKGWHPLHHHISNFANDRVLFLARVNCDNKSNNCNYSIENSQHRPSHTHKPHSSLAESAKTGPTSHTSPSPSTCYPASSTNPDSQRQLPC